MTAITHKSGISRSALIIIAITSMLIDITANFIIPPLSYIFPDDNTVTILIRIYFVMRGIGRINIFIFCFLLVDDFLNMENKKKYLFSLTIFALIVEISLDLACLGRIDFVSKNMFFTLFIGLVMLIAIRKVEEKYQSKSIIKWFGVISIIILGSYISYTLNTDYSANGVITIATLYIFRKSKFQVVLGYVVFMVFMVLIPLDKYAFIIQLPSIFALIPIYMYNKEKGIDLKYFFYGFYPVYISALYFVARLIRSR